MEKLKKQVIFQKIRELVIIHLQILGVEEAVVEAVAAEVVVVVEHAPNTKEKKEKLTHISK